LFGIWSLEFEDKTNCENKTKNRTDEHLNYSIAFNLPVVDSKEMKK